MTSSRLSPAFPPTPAASSGNEASVSANHSVALSVDRPITIQAWKALTQLTGGGQSLGVSLVPTLNSYKLTFGNNKDLEITQDVKVVEAYAHNDFKKSKGDQ